MLHFFTHSTASACVHRGVLKTPAAGLVLNARRCSRHQLSYQQAVSSHEQKPSRNVIRRFRQDVATETEQETQSNVNTETKRAYLIYNPVAGQENPATILGDIALKLSDKYQLTVCQTKVCVHSCYQGEGVAQSSRCILPSWLCSWLARQRS